MAMKQYFLLAVFLIVIPNGFTYANLRDADEAEPEEGDSQFHILTVSPPADERQEDSNPAVNDPDFIVKPVSDGDDRQDVGADDELDVVPVPEAVRDLFDGDNGTLFYVDLEEAKREALFSERATTDCGCGYSNNNPSGRMENRIVGGSVVSPEHAYPFQALVQACYSTVCGSCGGTLLNKRFVLTAAHCVFDRSNTMARTVQVSLGLHNRFESGGNVQRFSVSRIFSNNYDPNSLTNDIALLELSQDVVFNSDVRPACLPTVASRTYTGYQAVVSGWGAIAEGASGSSTLKSTVISVVSNSDPTCTVYGNLPMTRLCAYTAGTGSCYGDSGGPLFIREDGRYTVIGLVSAAANCYYRGTAAIYTRVTAYLNWINSNIASGACGGSSPTPSPTPAPGQACDLTCTNLGTLTGRYYINGILSTCSSGICRAEDGSNLCQRLGISCPKRCDLSCRIGALTGRYYINGILSTCQSGVCYAEDGRDLCTIFGFPCGSG